MDAPAELLARVFNESQQTHASHRRFVKDLAKCRHQSGALFSNLFKRCIFRIFDNMKKEASIERLVKLVTSFVTYRDESVQECNEFLEDFIGFLLSAVDAANKAVRYRSCQILSEVILALPEEAEVKRSLWDEMISCMQRRIQDKVTGIRLFAARALQKLFIADAENDSIISQYQLCLSSDPSPDVRKAAVLAIPVSNETIADIVERTGDVHAAVRKAAFSVIGNKLPIKSLSIRQRTIILQRGLLDRDSAVQMECRNMLNNAWLLRDCEMAVQELLRFLDVETNEKVGELVMQELLKEELTEMSGSLRNYFSTTDVGETNIRLMEPEEALYWRMLCTYLHSEAQDQSLEAAKTRGAHADVLEAEASDKSELLDAILPATVADFVKLVEAHHFAGVNYAFASRQLVMLAHLLDYTDTSNRKAAAALINDFLHNLTKIVGDGIYLGGEKEWSDAVVQLSHKVHAAPGAFNETMAQAVVDLGKPCREGGAKVHEWLQCLAVTGIFLENLKHIRELPAHLIESQELVDGLLIPGVNHSVPEVKRSCVRCLSLYCHLIEQLSQRIIRLLEAALHDASDAVKTMAVKGIFDLIMRHGPELLDKQRRPDTQNVEPILQVLLNFLSTSTGWSIPEEDGEMESSRSAAVEGFAKLLMQSKMDPYIQPLQTIILSSLVRIYFDEDTKDIPRLRQCLSVFFHNYASAAAEHKRKISQAFIPLMRQEWPGISGGACNPHVATMRKKCATQMSRFMLELLKQPLYSQLKSNEAEDGCVLDNEAPDEGHEALAIALANEIMLPKSKKVALATVKSYKSALCKILVSLKFRPSQQTHIKVMRNLLDLVINEMSGEKLLLKELKTMASDLKKLDEISDEVLDDDQLASLLAAFGISMEVPIEEPQPKTPGPRTKQKPRQTAVDTDSEEDDFQSPVPTKGPTSVRTQRTCKTVAMERMESIRVTTKRRMIDFESESSETTSEEEEDEES